MKLFKFIVVFAFISFLSSCGNDDDENPSGEGIIGAWKVTEINYTGLNIASQAGAEVEIPFTGKGVDMNLNITFGNDMKYTTSGDYAVILTTELFGQSIEQRSNNFSFVRAGTWKEEGNQIIITDSNSIADTLTILENTGNKLKVEWENNFEVEQQGTLNTFESKGTYTFERK